MFIVAITLEGIKKSSKRRTDESEARRRERKLSDRGVSGRLGGRKAIVRVDGTEPAEGLITQTDSDF